MAEFVVHELDESYSETGNRANRPDKTGKKAKKLKELRHGQKEPLIRNCSHKRRKNGDSPVYFCDTFSDEDVTNFNAMFYATSDKKTQDHFMSLYIETSIKHRNRQRPGDGVKRRNRSAGETQFFMRGKFSVAHQRVCKDFFMRSLGGIGRRRLENVAADLHQSGGIREEKRGGDRKSVNFADRVEKIKCFIKSIPGRESHYGRDKSRKIYFPAELKCVKNLWNLFLQKHSEEKGRVSYKYFLKVVRMKFRIGFGSIKTDTCSFCESHRYQIKTSTDLVQKNSLMAELTVHKRRSNVFYELINEMRPKLKTFSFDHQQNLVLPRVPDQQAYYSRQFYVYNFSLVEVVPGGSLSPANMDRGQLQEGFFCMC